MIILEQAISALQHGNSPVLFFFCHLTGSLGGEVADFFRSQQPHRLMIHAPQASVFYLNMISAAIRKPFSALALTQIIKTWLHSDN